MERDYVREVAKAVGNGQAFHGLAKRLVNEIEMEKGRLSQQQFMIRQFMGLYPDPDRQSAIVVSGKVSANISGNVITGNVVQANGEGGLTETQRAKIMELAESLYRQRGVRKRIDPNEVIKLLEAQGEHLTVQQPRSVIGSFLYRAKKRVEKANRQAVGNQ